MCVCIFFFLSFPVDVFRNRQSHKIEYEKKQRNIASSLKYRLKEKTLHLMRPLNTRSGVGSVSIGFLLYIVFHTSGDSRQQTIEEKKIELQTDKSSARAQRY